MSCIPEVLNEYGGSFTIIWFAGVLNEKVFKKKYKLRAILTVDITSVHQEIKELMEELDRTNESRRLKFHSLVTLAVGITRIIKYQFSAYNDQVKNFQKEITPITFEWKKKDKTSDDEPNPINYEEIPEVNLNFNEDFPADAHLLPEADIPFLQQIKFPELEAGFGSVSMSYLDGFMMGTSLENDLFRLTIRDPGLSTTEDVSAPDGIFDVTLTPSKRRQATEADTPSKRRRRTLGNLFNNVQDELKSSDIHPQEINVEVPVPEPESEPEPEPERELEPEPEPEPERIPTPEQEVPPLIGSEQEPSVNIPPVQEAEQDEQDTLEKLEDLDLSSLQVSKRRKVKKNIFFDLETAISSDQLKKNQRDNIHTVSHQDVLMNLEIYRQTVNDLFNLLSTAWAKKSFRRPAGVLLANFQTMLVPICSANDIDLARHASVHPTTQLSDDILQGEQTTKTKRSLMDQTVTLGNVQDYPDNREQTDTEPTVDLPEISALDVDNEMQDIAPESSDTGRTLDVAAAAAADLTLLFAAPNEGDSNESLWTVPPKKSSQSQRLSDNIINIYDLDSEASSRRTPSPSSWTSADLRAQLEVLFQESPAVSFDNLVPPEENTRLDAITCLDILLRMASKNEITLEQEDDDDDVIWIMK